MTRLIALSGGIGTGKSTVGKILCALGFPVYNCDQRAKFIINEDKDIKALIIKHIHPGAYDEKGRYLRSIVADVVFNDPDKLNLLNEITHKAVKSDILSWKDKSDTSIAFVETALLYQSGINKMVDEVWEVTAPLNLRIERVCSRNNISEEDVMKRIKAQDIKIERRHQSEHIICNDNLHSLLLQIDQLLAGNDFYFNSCSLG